MRSCPAPDEGGARGDGDERLGDGGELLIIAGEATVLDDPGEGALDHPAAAQHLKALGGRAALDDLDDDVGFVLCPPHQPTGVAAVGEGECDEGISGAGRLQHQFAAVAILDVGGVNLHSEETTVGIGQDMALAAFDLLARVVAFRAPF